MKHIHTFSIAAYDASQNAWGVAVSSKFLACASVVPWAKAGAGAIATQSLANLDYGQLGLKLLERGYSAQRTLDALLKLDDDISERQVGIVDANGGSAAFTGEGCFEHAMHRTGPGYSCQGNMLGSAEVVPTLERTYLENEGMPLAKRLVTALEAAEKAGGDGRGKQAAGVLVVSPNGSYGGYTDRAVDLRVDDSEEPVTDLLRLVDLHALYFGKPKPEDIIPIEGETLEKLQAALHALGFSKAPNGIWDTDFAEAFIKFSNQENFEERLLDGKKVDAAVLRFMMEKAGL